MEIKQPDLAYFKGRHEYQPAYGDYVVWSGWFATWHGFVVGYDKTHGILDIVFAGLPYILLTFTHQEQQNNIRKVPLSKITGSSTGAFAIHRHDKQQNAVFWFV